MTALGEYDDALVCHTTFKNCCRVSSGGNNLGNWIYPDGSLVSARNARNSLYRNKNSGVVNLHRIQNLTSVSGIFTCEIPISDSIIVSLHIFLYSGELPGNVIFK